MGGWTKLHTKKLHDLYALPSIIRKIKLRRLRWVGKPERKRPLGKPRCRKWIILRWILER
jgi:hypothetical protein